jgi:hypothetical protein
VLKTSLPLISLPPSFLFVTTTFMSTTHIPPFAFLKRLEVFIHGCGKEAVQERERERERGDDSLIGVWSGREKQMVIFIIIIIMNEDRSD